MVDSKELGGDDKRESSRFPSNNWRDENQNRINRISGKTTKEGNKNKRPRKLEGIELEKEMA